MVEDGLRDYVEFGKRMLAIANPDNPTAETIAGSNMPEFSASLIDTFGKAHLYRVDDATKILLMMTRSPSKNGRIRLPFREIFVGVHFTRSEIDKYFGVVIEYDDIFGLILQEGVVTADTGNGVHEIELGNTLRVIACCQSDEGHVDFQTINLNLDYDEDLDLKIEVKRLGSAKYVRKFVKMFVMNLLNMIHDPEIEVVHFERDDERNRKRSARGQLPIPAVHSIRLTGRRKVYVDSLIAGGHLSCGYKYFVAGSYRSLVSARYKSMRGEIIWVEPYFRGEGILVQKDYEVKA